MPLPLPSSSLQCAGVNVPLRAAFTGIKGVPLVAVATNNANPKLCLSDDHLEFRVLRTRRKTWAEIALIDVSSGGGPFLLFVWTQGMWTFSAHVVSEATRRQTLRFLQEKGVPLSPAARLLLDETDDNCL